MHHSEIDHEAKVTDALADLDEDDRYGYRPVLMESFVMVDGTDVLVPAEDSPEGMIVALTETQATQALLCLADQIGDAVAVKLIQERAGREGGGE
jgi:hypothetical protein